MTGSSLSSTEVGLAKSWAIQEGLAPSEIAERLGRDKSTITRLLRTTSKRKARGRKADQEHKHDQML